MKDVRTALLGNEVSHLLGDVNNFLNVLLGKRLYGNNVFSFPSG